MNFSIRKTVANTLYQLGIPSQVVYPALSFYTNTVWVDPTDSNTVVVGGVHLARTTDRGLHWQQVGGASHLDHHIIVEDPGYTGSSGNNMIVYCATDGGIYRTEDILAGTVSTSSLGPVIWNSLNNTLGVTQFYGAAGNVLTGKILGGTQDNGTLGYSGNSEGWNLLSDGLGGDGGYCAADQVDESEEPYYYGEAPNLEIYRITPSTVEYIWNGMASPLCNGRPCAAFIAPFVLDPNDRERIFAGGSSLWRTNNARASNALQVAWTEIKFPIPNNPYITAIAVAQGDSDYVWVGYRDGSVFYTTTGTAGPGPTLTANWTNADPNNVLPTLRACTRITIGAAQDPEQPTVARTARPIYITFGGFVGMPQSGNVWKRQANGTWVNIHNNLPKVPVYSLVTSANDPNVLYVGTEIGVFASVNGGTTWSPGNGGPANTRVVELFWQGSKLVAVTHGRGMFVLPSPTI